MLTASAGSRQSRHQHVAEQKAQAPSCVRLETLLDLARVSGTLLDI